MNILPLIISLILIFSFFTNVLFVKNKNSTLISISYSGYMKAKRDAMNNYQKELYNLVDGKTKKNINVNNNRILSNSENNKTRIPSPLNAKINITSLFIDNNQDLYNLLKNLIKNLYQDQNFYKKNLEVYLLNNLIDEAKLFLKDEKNSIIDLSLAKLKLKDENLQNIFYKILKGTKFYDSKNNIGFPSILDYIEIRSHKNVNVPIIDASFEVLSIIFNEKIANDILEKQKVYPVKNLYKEDVINLASRSGFKAKDSHLRYLDFSNSNFNPNKIIVGIDINSGIKVQKKLIK
ncbi:MAG: hypothetical protein K1060chlam5_00163 [Candidatus Anoxychlamydiales bacterium]|nr:hypothetical protein [Candidatus Anoxychlamydiales bacterium]